MATRPQAGDLKAFSAVCTHPGRIVPPVGDGGEHSITDGAVEAGPAPHPPPAERITVEGDSIRPGRAAYPRAHDHP